MFPDPHRRHPRFEFPRSTGAGPRQFSCSTSTEGEIFEDTGTWENPCWEVWPHPVPAEPPTSVNTKPPGPVMCMRPGCVPGMGVPHPLRSLGESGAQGLSHRSRALAAGRVCDLELLFGWKLSSSLCPLEAKGTRSAGGH